MSGLHYESLADLPEGLRQQAARKLLKGADKPLSVAGNTGEQVSAPKCDDEKTHSSKYHNIKTEVDGIRFDSRKEARRYVYLMEAMRKGVIEDLRLQVDFTLQEAYTTALGERVRAIRYKADFTYKVKSAGYEYEATLLPEDLEYWRSLWPGELVVEDVKSNATRTAEYKLKRKLMTEKGYEIREV